MADFETHLTRWQQAGLLDPTTAQRIVKWERDQIKPAGLRWQGIVALTLGAILLAGGVVLFVNAHWDQLSPAWRFALVMSMVAVFHLGGAAARDGYRALSTALHAVGTVSTGAAIALVGQIFHIQEHWPAAILLWAIAALAGWILLLDQAQQIFTLLLLPAWLICEYAYAWQGHIGESVYLGRLLLVWAVLYATLFLQSKRQAAQEVLFAVAMITGVVSITMMIEGWRSWSSQQLFLGLGTRLWAWLGIAGIPLVISVIRLKRSTVPVLAALLLGLALPWTVRHHSPRLLTYALVAAFAVFLAWWGVKLTSQLLVNLGVVAFAASVAWFYFSDILDKMNRSLGLIGLGVLFLAGGWGLETLRRRLMADMMRPRPGEAR